MYSLRMSFWIVPRSAAGAHALLLGHELVEQEQERRGRVDRHRRRDLVERDAGEQACHVGQRVDRDAGAADLAARHAGRRSRSPAGSAGRTRSRGRSGRGRAGSGSARSTPPPRRSRRTGASSTAGRGTCPGTAARVGVLARRLELTRRVGGRVDGLHLDARLGAPIAALSHGVDRRGLRGRVTPRAHRPHGMCDRHARRPRRGGQRR